VREALSAFTRRPHGLALLGQAPDRGREGRVRGPAASDGKVATELPDPVGGTEFRRCS
jgi:hypothetical protein